VRHAAATARFKEASRHFGVFVETANNKDNFSKPKSVDEVFADPHDGQNFCVDEIRAGEIVDEECLLAIDEWWGATLPALDRQPDEIPSMAICTDHFLPAAAVQPSDTKQPRKARKTREVCPSEDAVHIAREISTENAPKRFHAYPVVHSRLPGSVGRKHTPPGRDISIDVRTRMHRNRNYFEAERLLFRVHQIVHVLHPRDHMWHGAIVRSVCHDHLVVSYLEAVGVKVCVQARDTRKILRPTLLESALSELSDEDQKQNQSPGLSAGLSEQLAETTN
jgi:hypothetical protein